MAAAAAPHSYLDWNKYNSFAYLLDTISEDYETPCGYRSAEERDPD
jgi:hypothetical protein